MQSVYLQRNMKKNADKGYEKTKPKQSQFQIGRQKAEGRRQKAEGRRQKAEGRRQKAEGGEYAF